MQSSFSIREAVRFGWHTLKVHSALVFQLVLTLLALQVVSAIVQKVLAGSALGVLASLVLAVVGVFVGTGATLIVLKLARGEHARYDEIFPHWRLVARFFLSGLLAALAVVAPIVVGGFVALLVGVATLGNFISFSEGAAPPAAFGAAGVAGVVALLLIALVTLVVAVYLGLRFSMVRFAVVDGARIVESLERSATLTRGVKWKLLGFFIVLVLLNIVGAILLLVGLLVTVPVSMIAAAHVYLKLKGRHHAPAH